MNKLWNIIGGLAALILFLPLIIIIIPVVLINDALTKRKVRQWLKENDYTYFLIYTAGKSKRKFYEENVLPQLNPGIKSGVFDGACFKGFIDQRIAVELSLYDNEGFPIIGKIEEGILTKKSLKQEYKQLVVMESNKAAFIEEIQNRIDEL